MSIQFGRWNFEGQQPAPDYIEKVSATLAPYGPDSNETYSNGGVKVLYRAFHTTKESRCETQPYVSQFGTVISWDGRLDNRAELVNELHDSLTITSTDVAIVARAYEEWGTNCFAKLIGDWALSIWSANDCSLILAKDLVGTRHLYYSIEKDHITWSTILAPLVLFAERTFEICEEYIAGWLSMFPAAHLTPYVGIYAVPPSSSVLLQPGKHGVKHIVRRYWDFDPVKKIRYRTDAEYEEHFRSVFATAVKRRLRSDRPVLAELSGGMDSSSIVCMAHTIIACGGADTPRLDTISWYDDSYDHIEPDSNELHWVSKVEEKRGRTGYHINLSAQRHREDKEAAPQESVESEFESDHFAAVPVANRLSEFFMLYAEHMRVQEHRVTLSGLGGDEATGGGVPTPAPELQNLLARARFLTLVHQLNAWAAKMKKSRLLLLWEAAQGLFLARTPLSLFIDTRPAPWLQPDFVRRNRGALHAYPSRLKLFGPLPSFQDNMRKLSVERRLQAYINPISELPREVRYPYLDRDFLEFMYAVPREQIVRVGQRRSLLRRALVGIVPSEVLNRKRKTDVQQETRKSLSIKWANPPEINGVIASSIGIIHSNRFFDALQKARQNHTAPFESLSKTLMLESWLRHLRGWGVLANSMATKGPYHSSILGSKKLPAPAQPKSSAS